MKNVIIFQDFIKNKTYGHDWKQEELFAYFRAQVDNSIRLGWDINDIVICTNLNFQYKDVRIVKLREICQYNKYFNKQYGIYEILRDSVINDPFWFHDFDDWQLEKFEFPEFFGDIGMCKYINFSQWNTGSIFVKPSSRDIWELIFEFMKINDSHESLLQVGDENVFNYIFHTYPELHTRITEIDLRYNIGVTQFSDRYDRAKKPICIGAFKPFTKDHEVFKQHNLVDAELERIFETHLSVYANI